MRNSSANDDNRYTFGNAPLRSERNMSLVIGSAHDVIYTIRNGKRPIRDFTLSSDSMNFKCFFIESRDKKYIQI